MPIRNVILDEQQDRLIEDLVRSGRFRSAGDVIGEGLRMVHGREMGEAGKLDVLRAEARLGIAVLDRGDFKDFSDVAALTTHLDDVAQRLPSGPKRR